jgi:hypothetical protein
MRCDRIQIIDVKPDMVQAGQLAPRACPGDGIGGQSVLQKLEEDVGPGSAEVSPDDGVVLVAELWQRLEPQGTVEALRTFDVGDTNADMEAV